LAGDAADYRSASGVWWPGATQAQLFRDNAYSCAEGFRAVQALTGVPAVTHFLRCCCLDKGVSAFHAAPYKTAISFPLLQSDVILITLAVYRITASKL